MNSAASAIVKGRDEKKYGVLSIRGKLINTLSNPQEKIYENEEIKLLLSAMNIVPNWYNSGKLRYGKIGICVDADSDGSHIALLIMSALAYFAPQFLLEGRLFWLRSPLYIIKNGKQENYYFTDEEFNKCKNKVKGEQQRNKGLGSLSSSQVKQSMFNPTNQRLEPITVTNEGLELLELLMGEDVEPRKEFVMKNVDFSVIRE